MRKQLRTSRDLPSRVEGRARSTPGAERRFDVERRVLIVDDTKAIHDDFHRTLQADPRAGMEIDELTSAVFGEVEEVDHSLKLELHHAFQGQEAIDMVGDARARGDSYALVFMDVRMPPGMDGVEATVELLKIDPHVQVVICSAYSDHSWKDFRECFGMSDRVLILKKPFDTVEVRQLAASLTLKWALVREAAQREEGLARLVDARTSELEAVNASLRLEMESRQRAEEELRLAQKLEAVGQLAAGVAHEINTPMQYVGDSVHFLQRSFESIWTALSCCHELCEAMARGDDGEGLLESAVAALDDADLEYLERRVPRAFERASDGVQRVSSIVCAMKEFSHPSRKEKAPSDIERALSSTITVARNEYKYVADVTTDFVGLPPILCNIGELNQVFLNMIVNASHAIADVVAGTERKGSIEVRTSLEGAMAVIEIRDDGAGVPEEIRERIFDPFFTTKEVGKGTGQGLSMARSIIIDKHGGAIALESTVGEGTAFFIRLPVDGESESS